VPVIYPECAQCGAQTHTTWKWCSFDCKGLYAKEYVARGVATNRQRIASKPNPLSDALGMDDGVAVLQVLRKMSRVTPKGCWIPNSGDVAVSDRKGYRYAYLGYRPGFNRYVALHRVALEAKEGRSLGSEHAHHTCANRSCCNPDHLQPASAIDNQLEMLERSALRARVKDLTAALAEIAPDHPLLRDKQC